MFVGRFINHKSSDINYFCTEMFHVDICFVNYVHNVLKILQECKHLMKLLPNSIEYHNFF